MRLQLSYLEYARRMYWRAEKCRKMRVRRLLRQAKRKEQEYGAERGNPHGGSDRG